MGCLLNHVVEHILRYSAEAGSNVTTGRPHS